MIVKISKSVGFGGVNLPRDVKIVQAALNAIPAASGGPSVKLVVDGIVGPKTIAAIRGFQQKTKGAVVDGRVDAGKSTEAALLSFEGGQGSGQPISFRIADWLGSNLRRSGWQYDSGAGVGVGFGPLGFAYGDFKALRKGSDDDFSGPLVDYSQPGDPGDKPIPYKSVALTAGALGWSPINVSLDVANSVVSKPSWIVKSKNIPYGKPLTIDHLTGATIAVNGQYNGIPGQNGGGRSAALIFFGVEPQLVSLVGPLSTAFASLTAGMGIPVALTGNLLAVALSSKCMCLSLGSQSGVPSAGVGVSAGMVTYMKSPWW